MCIGYMEPVTSHLISMQVTYLEWFSYDKVHLDLKWLVKLKLATGQKGQNGLICLHFSGYRFYSVPYGREMRKTE